MDLLSLTGAASVGVSLSTALFDLISSYAGDPRDIAEIARGVSDLSLVLDRLIVVVEDGSQICQRKLVRSVDSAIQKVKNVQREIWQLVDAGKSNPARLQWVFRRSKTMQLLFRIEAHKSMLQIVTTTILLAMEQRKYARYCLPESHGAPVCR